YAMAPCTTDLFSSGVLSRRLLLANFRRPSPKSVIAKWPFASSINTPRGFGPSASYLLPSGRILTFETIVQVPTSCSLRDFCWLTALVGSSASPNAIIADRLRTLRRSIDPSHSPTEHQRPGRRNHAPLA